MSLSIQLVLKNFDYFCTFLNVLDPTINKHAPFNLLLLLIITTLNHSIKLC